MSNHKLKLLKSNLEFYAMDIEIIESFDNLLNQINIQPSIL